MNGPSSVPATVLYTSTSLVTSMTTQNTRASELMQSMRQFARHTPASLALMLVAGVTALTLSACGGGGGGSNPPPPTPPTSSISIFAGNPNAVGSQNGPAASALFDLPTGVAIDPVGNVYVADSQNFTIRKITGMNTTNVNVTTFAGSANNPGSANGTGSAASFAGPQSIAISPAGNLYVTDQGDEAVTVREITPAGQVTTLVDPRTSQALQTDGSTILATDSASNLYLYTIQAATGASVLTQVTPSGAVNVITLTTATGLPLGLVNPQGIATDSANNVYIADENVENSAGVLYKVAITGASGRATTLAGSTATAGTQDGPGNAATFDGLAALTVDPSGNIYANDFNNGTIREISSAGVVSTLAGTPGQSGLYLGQLPGVLPDIAQLAWFGNSLYTPDMDDNVILKLNPAP